MGRYPKLEIHGPDYRVSLDDVKEQGLVALFEPASERPPRIVVEIGFGRGEFVIDLAQNDPEAVFFAVEVKLKRVLKMAHRLVRYGISNIRILHATGQELIDALPADSVVDTFWVNFPDPWPKKSHEHRRMLTPEFIHGLALRLVPGGKLELATDDEIYAESIDAALRGEPLLENLLAPEPFVAELPGRKPTAYELLWREEGRKLHFWRYRKPSGSGAGSR